MYGIRYHDGALTETKPRLLGRSSLLRAAELHKPLTCGFMKAIMQ